ncbi:MAG TPA: hypothetical protein VKA09_05820 [Nitrososphaeraceae archaeon]|nr:hypothetical protein [Nitrososphaeraceae archaeon]
MPYLSILIKGLYNNYINTIPSQGYSKLLYLLIKSLQEIFGINRNLKQIRSLATDEKIKLNFKNVNIARESLQDALKRIEFILNEATSSSMSSFIELSRLKKEIKDIPEINLLFKETYISFKLLLAELKLK